VRVFGAHSMVRNRVLDNGFWWVKVKHAEVQCFAVRNLMIVIIMLLSINSLYCR